MTSLIILLWACGWVVLEAHHAKRMQWIEFSKEVDSVINQLWKASK